MWIVSLIGLAVYLIVVEYLHDKMQRQLAMTGMTTEDLIHEIKRRKEANEKYMGNLPKRYKAY